MSARSPTKKAATLTPATPLRSRTKSTGKPSASPANAVSKVRPKSSMGDLRKLPRPDDDPPPMPSLSIRDQIALKRAEAKKMGTSVNNGKQANQSEEAPASSSSASVEEEDALGRWSTRETIERARNTGNLNLSARCLPCIPTALFEIHLGVTPVPLKSVPNEPILPPESPKRTQRGNHAPSWYNAQDLLTLKAWSNEIIEIQPEISMFGSLKAIDLHNNRLRSLPDTFADLSCLKLLDLSHNSLISLPTRMFALPELTSLNISHNKLTSLPFNAPFKSGSLKEVKPASSFFEPAVVRAITPLPKLAVLDASNNRITADEIDAAHIPSSVTSLVLSENPLGQCIALLRALAALPRLKQLSAEKAIIDDESFPADLLRTNSHPFPSLQTLDLGETKVTRDSVEEALSSLQRIVNYEHSGAESSNGELFVFVGKKVVKEAWEIEVEKRAKGKASRHVPSPEIGENERSPTPQQDTRPSTPKPAVPRAYPPKLATPSTPKKPVEKEPWEIEAEQGLLTEGGRRKARAAAAAAARVKAPTPSESPAISRKGSPSNDSTMAQYYSTSTQTLTLPASSAPKPTSHGRSFSVALKANSDVPTLHLGVPSPTLPLSSITLLPFALTLKVLILNNRRLDKSFSLPFLPLQPNAAPLLPCLQELRLEGCQLADSVVLSSADESVPRQTKPILSTIATLFPTLERLDLSYNNLTSASLATETLSHIIVGDDTCTPPRRGLKHILFRGNQIDDLAGLQGVAEAFKGNRLVPGWKLEELDIRDNAIARLPPELGLLPLDVLLVDGNLFRVPQRKIWEREGTRGLQSWLRGRIE